MASVSNDLSVNVDVTVSSDQRLKANKEINKDLGI